jgi:hypothetical protein
MLRMPVRIAAYLPASIVFILTLFLFLAEYGELWKQLTPSNANGQYLIVYSAPQ